MSFSFVTLLGIGYDLLVDVLRYVSPTSWIQSAYQDRYNRSVLIHKDARLMTDMCIIAYFRQCIKGKEGNTIRELTRELVSHTPY
ncbi:PREDICTED: polynucleotide 5'-hydroxyl-kinase NOL9-like [Camelina sativa]|uniref:Polynucleotide 5'-hydroxyl-kinase NOL9-like n=1 Tax=Camelina sativa TaxID=90675 RepID=A0ABM0XVL4_CAMSA|nr:PREDICTED: polynucleotide 5'-hydroxyl-kinase NOL9-like [Camelina sativa]